MDYRALVTRIRGAVDVDAYIIPSVHLDPRYRAAMDQITASMSELPFDAARVRSRIEDALKAGRIDAVLYWSAKHVLACHPRVRDWSEAARCVAMQEVAALEAGGARLASSLAAVERHRGVLAFLQGHSEVALDYFTRALERERSAENLANILCALLRLGDEDEARGVLDRVRAGLPPELVRDLNQHIATDPDLQLLRDEGEP